MDNQPWAWDYYCKQAATGGTPMEDTLREFVRRAIIHADPDGGVISVRLLGCELAAAIGANECTGLHGSESGSSGSSSSPSSPRSTPTAEKAAADPASVPDVVERLKAVEARLAAVESRGKLYDTVNGARIIYRKALEKIAADPYAFTVGDIARAALGKEQP